MRDNFHQLSHSLIVECVWVSGGWSNRHMGVHVHAEVISLMFSPLSKYLLSIPYGQGLC